MKIAERFGQWRCSRGHHAVLHWTKKDKHDAALIAAGSVAREIFVASGLLDLAEYIGFCSRCGKATSWASFDPSISPTAEGTQ